MNFQDIWKLQCSQYDIEYQPDILPKTNRIIVIGDIHGDFESMIKLLRTGKVIDTNNNWIGEDTIVVQVGDQIDRCRFIDKPCNQVNYNEGNDLKILYFFTELHKKASKYGGAVYSLMGNHELMNVNGDLRYVSYDGLEEFKEFKDYNSNKILGNSRYWAFKPGNPLSNFLACTRKMVLIIGSNLFVHGGIIPEISKKYKISDLNQILSYYLWDKLNNSNRFNDILFDKDSPLWTRKYSKISSSLECQNNLIHLKDIYKVGKIYVGHTPYLTTGINSKCDNKIWFTDYGVSKAFDPFQNETTNLSRKIHVLEILNDGEHINILHEDIDKNINIIKNNINICDNKFKNRFN